MEEVLKAGREIAVSWLALGQGLELSTSTYWAWLAVTCSGSVLLLLAVLGIVRASLWLLYQVSVRSWFCLQAFIEGPDRFLRVHAEPPVESDFWTSDVEYTLVGPREWAKGKERKEAASAVGMKEVESSSVTPGLLGVMCADRTGYCGLVGMCCHVKVMKPAVLPGHLLLTAAHVIRECLDRCNANSVQPMFELRRLGDQGKGPSSIVYCKDAKALFFDPKHDLLLLSVQPSVFAKLSCPALPMALAGPDAFWGRVYVSTKSKIYVSEGLIEGPGATSAHKVPHPLSTLSGSSGCPMLKLKGSRTVVVGVHTGALDDLGLNVYTTLRVLFALFKFEKYKLPEYVAEPEGAAAGGEEEMRITYESVGYRRERRDEELGDDYEGKTDTVIYKGQRFDVESSSMSRVALRRTRHKRQREEYDDRNEQDMRDKRAREADDIGEDETYDQIIARTEGADWFERDEQIYAAFGTLERQEHSMDPTLNLSPAMNCIIDSVEPRDWELQKPGAVGKSMFHAGFGLARCAHPGNPFIVARAKASPDVFSGKGSPYYDAKYIESFKALGIDVSDQSWPRRGVKQAFGSTMYQITRMCDSKPPADWKPVADEAISRTPTIPESHIRKAGASLLAGGAVLREQFERLLVLLNPDSTPSMPYSEFFKNNRELLEGGAAHCAEAVLDVAVTRAQLLLSYSVEEILLMSQRDPYALVELGLCDPCGGNVKGEPHSSAKLFLPESTRDAARASLVELGVSESCAEDLELSRARVIYPTTVCDQLLDRFVDGPINNARTACSQDETSTVGIGTSFTDSGIATTCAIFRAMMCVAMCSGLRSTDVTGWDTTYKSWLFDICTYIRLGALVRSLSSLRVQSDEFQAFFGLLLRRHIIVRRMPILFADGTIVVPPHSYMPSGWYNTGQENSVGRWFLSCLSQYRAGVPVHRCLAYTMGDDCVEPDVVLRAQVERDFGEFGIRLKEENAGSGQVAKFCSMVYFIREDRAYLTTFGKSLLRYLHKGPSQERADGLAVAYRDNPKALLVFTYLTDQEVFPEGIVWRKPTGKEPVDLSVLDEEDSYEEPLEIADPELAISEAKSILKSTGSNRKPRRRRGSA